MPAARRAIPGSIADYIVNHERKAGIGSLAGWRGSGGDRHGTGAPNPRQLDAYIAHGCFWRHEMPPRGALLQARQPRLSRMGGGDGLHRRARARSCCSSTARRCSASASPPQGTGAAAAARPRIARASPRYFDPLPIWYRPFEEDPVDGGEFPLHAITQRPMAMYHSWGSQNAWLRQIHGENRLYHPPRPRQRARHRRRRLGRGRRAITAASPCRRS